MKIFSWYTLDEKDDYGRYIGSKIYGEGSPFAFKRCYNFYKPNRKGRYYTKIKGGKNEVQLL